MKLKIYLIPLVIIIIGSLIMPYEIGIMNGVERIEVGFPQHFFMIYNFDDSDVFIGNISINLASLISSYINIYLVVYLIYVAFEKIKNKQLMNVKSKIIITSLISLAIVLLSIYGTPYEFSINKGDTKFGITFFANNINNKNIFTVFFSYLQTYALVYFIYHLFKQAKNKFNN